jgi:hypothetical protein
LIKQRKELRQRTLELVAKQKEALSAMHSAMTAFRAGTPIPDPEFLTPEEERELKELLVRNGRMDDVKRFVAANSDRFRIGWSWRHWRRLPGSWGTCGPGGRCGRTGSMRRSWCSSPRPRAKRRTSRERQRRWNERYGVTIGCDDAARFLFAR